MNRIMKGYVSKYSYQIRHASWSFCIQICILVVGNSVRYDTSNDTVDVHFSLGKGSTWSRHALESYTVVKVSQRG